MPAPEEPAVFELRGAEVRYRHEAALGPAELRVEEGRTLALIGPSGGGKSTVLKLLLGLVSPSSGEVRFRGQPLTPASAPGLRRRMGYVVQGGGLFPHLTAGENVTLLARHLRWERARSEARVAELLALTRFPQDGLARYPAQLSGGQAQRVSLMRALLLDPEVLLLDEPLGALDPITRRALQDELRALFAQLHKTVVLVTHDLGEAAFFAHRVALLRGGRIVQQGPLEELLRAPAEPYIAEFIRAQRPLLPMGTVEPPGPPTGSPLEGR